MVVELDKQESALLAELGEIFNLSNSAGWHKITVLMDELTEEAHEDMIGHTGDAEMAARLLLRWQQRESMKRAVYNYIIDCLTRRAMILDEISEREEVLRSNASQIA